MPATRRPPPAPSPASLRRPRRARPLPAVQPRALATQEALLAAGRRLLRDRTLEELSVADVAAESGMSVGSFYGRFRDKASYFAVMQERANADWLEEGRAVLLRRRARPDAARLLQEICSAYVGIFRRERGFVLAALRHASTHPGSWTPFRAAGQSFVAQTTTVLEPLLGHLPKAQRAPRLRFAMQLMFATGVNAVLHDPGPIRLEDPKLERELARALCAYLEVPWKQAS